MGRGPGSRLAPLLRDGASRRRVAPRYRRAGLAVLPAPIQPHVLRGEKVLISAHGNSLRALIMALDGLTPDEIVKLELPTGLPILYRLNADTTVAEKRELAD